MENETVVFLEGGHLGAGLWDVCAGSEKTAHGLHRMCGVALRHVHWWLDSLPKTAPATIHGRKQDTIGGGGLITFSSRKWFVFHLPVGSSFSRNFREKEGSAGIEKR